jgi:phage/plasmid-associated DNA primase
VSIPLNRLTNRFEVTYIQNKLVNICGDIDNQYIRDTGQLKYMIGGDKGLRAEIKHGKSYEFNPVCRFMFSANTIPNVGDKTFGWISRWKFVEFPNTFKVDPAYKIAHTNLFEQEKSGILNWAIQGLQRLKEQNSWTQGEKMLNAEEEYREQNDNVAAFLTAYVSKVEYNGTQHTLTVNNILHDCYNEWIRNNLSGSQVVSMTEFSKRVVGFGYRKTTRVIDGKSRNVYLGMKVKDEFIDDYKALVRLSKNY